MWVPYSEGNPITLGDQPGDVLLLEDLGDTAGTAKIPDGIDGSGLVNLPAAAAAGNAKAWASLDGTGTTGFLDSYNMSSFTDHDVGQFSFSFDTDFASGDYVATGHAKAPSDGTVVFGDYSTPTKTVSAYRIRITNLAAANLDPDWLDVAFFGDQ